MKIYKKTLFIIIIVMVLFVELIFSGTVPFLKYADEVTAIISIISLAVWSLCHKGKIEKEYRKILLVISIVVAFGFVGNILNSVTRSYFSAAVDCLGTIKVFVSVIFVYTYLNGAEAKQTVALLYKPAKIFLWMAVFFGVVSIFTDIGMGGEVRYGLRAYSFVFEHAHILAITSISALAIIASNEITQKKLYFYTILACLCQLLTTKGPSIVWSIIIFFMFRYYVHNRKIKPWLIILIATVGILAGGYRITNYFMNVSAPRAILLKYGIETARRYFPWGAGFATYGSDMAKVYYSKLYYEYGFNHIWGMGEYDGMYLNDNYWPMAMGQFGFIGALFLLYACYLFFHNVQKKCSDRRVRAIMITNVVYILVHSLGSASLTSMEGTFLFVVFGVVLALYKSDSFCSSRKV